MDCLTSQCSHICINKDTSGYTCSCPYGMYLSRDLVTCEAQCPEDVFSCGDDQCVPHDWVCDGTMDCNNKADEEKCAGFIRGKSAADANERGDEKEPPSPNKWGYEGS